MAADVAGDSDSAGLREEKKRLTREAIAAAAMRLFAVYGFDAVTIAQIAEAARVSEKTVYNYFPRKTGLFFDEADSILAELLFTVGNRKPGQSALGAGAGTGPFESSARGQRPGTGPGRRDRAAQRGPCRVRSRRTVTAEAPRGWPG